MISQTDIDNAIKSKKIEKVFNLLPTHIRRHSERVGHISSVIYQRALELHVYFDDDLNKDYVKFIEEAAKYHDIGKIYCRDEILDRLAYLSDAEELELQEHAFNSSKVFEPFLDDPSVSLMITIASDVAMAHHEKWDGTGYPCNWQGDLTPLIARVVAIANRYDNLVNPLYTNDKTYTHEEAVDKIVSLSNKDFDPILIQVFIDCADVIGQYMNSLSQAQKEKKSKAGKSRAKKKKENEIPRPTSPFIFSLRPIYNVDDKKAKLISMKLELSDAQLGLIPETKFVQVAEKSNRIFDINQMEIAHAMDNIKILRNKYLSNAIIEVELSYRQLQREPSNRTYFTRLLNFMKDNQTYRNTLCLSFDSFAFYEGRVNKNSMDLLRKQGVNICLIERQSIHNVPQLIELYDMDYIKIDEKLLRNISFNDKEKKIFLNVINLVRSFGITPIIENIKSNINFKIYREAHIELYEGSYFKRDQKTITKTLLAPTELKGGQLDE